MKSILKTFIDYSLFEEFSEHLLAINENMQDLMVPFQKKWYVC